MATQLKLRYKVLNQSSSGHIGPVADRGGYCGYNEGDPFEYSDYKSVADAFEDIQKNYKRYAEQFNLVIIPCVGVEYI
jgi:hypothetical protein